METYAFRSRVGETQPGARPQLQHGFRLGSEYSDSRFGQDCRNRQTRQVGLRSLRMITTPKTVYSAATVRIASKNIQYPCASYYSATTQRSVIYITNRFFCARFARPQ